MRSAVGSDNVVITAVSLILFPSLPYGQISNAGCASNPRSSTFLETRFESERLNPRSNCEKEKIF